MKSPKGHREIVLSFFLTGWSFSLSTFHETPAPSSGKILSHLELQLGFCEALAFTTENFEASSNFLFVLSFFLFPKPHLPPPPPVLNIMSSFLKLGLSEK